MMADRIKKSKKEVLDAVSEKIGKLRRKAVEDGQNNEEVKKKILDAFNGFHWEKFETEDPHELSIWFFLRIFLRIVKWITLVSVLLIVILVLCYLAYLYNPYIEKKLRIYVHDNNVAYQVARVLRIMSFPLHQAFDLKQMQKWQCLVNNPFYRQDPANCEPCQEPFDIQTLQSNDKAINELVAVGDPAVLVGIEHYADKDYNYDTLRDLYLSNSKSLDFSVCERYGEDRKLTLAAYFARTQEVVYQAKKNYGWANCRIEGTRILRRLFNRPAFIPIMSEVYLEKYIFILHPDAPNKLQLPPCNTDNCFIFQVSGKSAIKFDPFKDCKKNCTETMDVELNKGQILYHTGSPWNIIIEALGSELSVLYRSEFT